MTILKAVLFFIIRLVLISAYSIFIGILTGLLWMWAIGWLEEKWEEARTAKARAASIVDPTGAAAVA